MGKRKHWNRVGINKMEMSRVSYSAIIIFLAVSCTDAAFTSQNPGQSRMTMVRFFAPETGTLDLCAFREDGSLDAHTRQSGAELTAELICGEPLRWWLVANAPEGLLDNVATVDQMMDTELLLESMNPDRPLMVGTGRDLFRDDSEKTVKMNNVSCKVSVGSLSPVFLDTGTPEPAEAYLDNVFLINASASIPLSLRQSADMLRNQDCLEPDLPEGLAVLLCKAVSMHLQGTETRNLDLSLYCFPNPLGSTKLVLDLNIGGRKNYYPIPIPSMERNVEYHIDEIVLLGEGSPSPAIPVDRKAIACEVTVLPWNTVEKTCIM